jgi:type IV pilus assembly protein PilM
VFGMKSNLRVGLDIGSHAIKMVIAERSSHGRQKLIKAISRDMYTGQEKYDPDGPKKPIAVPILLEMFQEAGIHPKRIHHLGSCIGGMNIAAKEILSVQLADEDMNSAILVEARKHLPLDGSESVVDYQVMGEDHKDPDKVRVLIAATTKRMFDAHLDILRELELKPGVIDLEPLAAVNSYISQVELPDEGVVVFLNLGARRTNLLIVGRKDTFFSRDIPVGGYAFTQEIMRKLDVKFTEAEEIKKSQGLETKMQVVSGGSGLDSLALSEKSAIDKLGDEINRSLRYYVKETGQSMFMKIILAGGMGDSKELCEYIQTKFGVETSPFDPLSSYDGASDVRHKAQFSAAAGLAARAQAI